MGITIGQLLAAARKAARLTQTALADLSGVPQGRISVYERGADVPGTPMIEKLVNGLQQAGSPIRFADFQPASLAQKNVSELLILTQPVTEAVVYRGPTLHSGAKGFDTPVAPVAGGTHAGSALDHAPPRQPKGRYIALPPDHDIARRFARAIPTLRSLVRAGVPLEEFTLLLADVVRAFNRGQIASTRTLEPREPVVRESARGRSVRRRTRKKP